MGGLDDLLMRIFTQKPRRKQVRGKFRLGMSWRHVDNQPFTLPVGYPFKRFRHLSMMPTHDKLGPHLPDELQEVFLRFLLT